MHSSIVSRMVRAAVFRVAFGKQNCIYMNRNGISIYIFTLIFNSNDTRVPVCRENVVNLEYQRCIPVLVDIFLGNVANGVCNRPMRCLRSEEMGKRVVIKISRGHCFECFHDVTM